LKEEDGVIHQLRRLQPEVIVLVAIVSEQHLARGKIGNRRMVAPVAKLRQKAG